MRGARHERALVGAIVVATAFAACDRPVTLDEVACPKGGTTLTYENFGKGFFAAYCNRCHSAAIGDRQGAPSNVAFDTRAEIAALADRIFVRAAGDNDSMPPGPDDPPRVTRDDLAEWLACGAP